MRPAIKGIHHLKFAVTDLDRSTAFYGAALGASRRTELDHRDGEGGLYAVILDVPGLGTQLELRLDEARARREAGFDPITLSVATRADLEQWQRHFAAVGVAHSGVLAAWVAWILVFEDPDGRRLRLYSDELHGLEVTPSRDPRWL